MEEGVLVRGANYQVTCYEKQVKKITISIFTEEEIQAIHSKEMYEEIEENGKQKYSCTIHKLS